MNGIPTIFMSDNGTANTRRLQLTPAQKDELHHLSFHLGVNLQQAYLRLRRGSIVLTSQ